MITIEQARKLAEEAYPDKGTLFMPSVIPLLRAGYEKAMLDHSSNSDNEWANNPLTDAVYEGAKAWQNEYDNCRAILKRLVELKLVKDKEGKTEEYQRRQPEAWKMAMEFLNQYQHDQA